MKIHLTGIGGVGMAGLAFLLKRRGHEVDGCDLKPTPRTKWLESQGIPVAIGHDPKHVEDKDLVIVTPAVAKDNPECRANRARLRARGEVLAKLVGDARDSIAVCGSHGKTTTATFIAKLLLALGEDVEWAIGGETGAFPVAGCTGNSPVLVVEADESDGTLARYHAKTLVVTNCEYDHPDHFKTCEDYFACYETAKANAESVILGGNTNEETAVKVARDRGHSAEAIAAVLPKVTSELPDRRFQRIADGVYTDYGHHPTEIRYSIAMARQKCRGVLRVLFQPHRHSRTAAFKREFAEALMLADEVVICPVYAAFEKPIEGGDSCDLYATMRSVGKCKIFLARSCGEAWEHARNSMGEGDVTLVQGAGDIIDLVPMIKAEMSERQQAYDNMEKSAWGGRRKRILIGAGSNTWKSDLKLDVEYVETEGPAGRAGAELLRDPAIAPLVPWMAGIPGTLGGWVKMNAGAFGHSISEVIAEVKVDGRWIPASACGFSYRHSDIVGEIQDVRFKSASACRQDAGTPESAAAYLARRKRFPAGTKGSVFKNPSGDFAGRLLEACGVKGLRVGGARVWEEHANVIVAEPEATPSDFLALFQVMRNRAFFRLGVRLEPEVCGLECGEIGKQGERP